MDFVFTGIYKCLSVPVFLYYITSNLLDLLFFSPKKKGEENLMTSMTEEDSLSRKFKELTMCEAQLAVLKKRYPLSDQISVRISNTAQVIFTCSPEQDFMAPTEVSFSCTAWKGLVNEVAEIEYWLTEVKNLDEKKKTWMFHPNTKFVRVSCSEYGNLMVSFMTINRRGSEMKQYSVYLKKEEWDALKLCMEDITESLKAMYMVKSSNHVKEMKTFVWKFMPLESQEEGQIEVMPPECKTAYFTEEHAVENGLQAEMDFKWPLGKMVILTDMKPPMDPMSFYLKVYFTILYHCCAVLNCMNCPGCKSNDSLGSSSHRTFHGCKVFGRCIVGDNLIAAKKGIYKDLVNQVFLRCWKVLKLSMLDVDKYWANVQIMLPEEVNEYLLARVNHVKDNKAILPEYLLINDHVNYMEIKSAMYPHRHVEDVSSDEDIADNEEDFSSKKLKLDSD